MAIPEMVIELVVALDNVAVMALLLEPTSTEPKLRVAGDVVTDPDVLEVPVPESATACGELLAESLKWRVAVRVPAAVGLK